MSEQAPPGGRDGQQWPPPTPTERLPVGPPPVPARPAYPAPSYPAPPYPALPYSPPGYPPLLAERPLPSFPHPRPTPYHEMLRTWNYAWWRPVVGVLVVVASMLLVAPLVLLPVLAAGVAIEGGPFWASFEKAATLKRVDAAALLYLNLVLGSMILVTWGVIRVVHRMRPRWLTSVLPKMRWKFFFACLGLAVLALLAQLLVGAALPGNADGDVSGAVNRFTTTTAVLALVVVLTTPLQAAGEEYVFRGYLLQAIGSLFGNKWVAILATATLFAVAHGAQNFPLFFDRFAFGLIAGWLVTRTGGLEAGIAMHILNNFLAFGLALTFGNITDTLTSTQASWWNIVLTVTQSGVYAALVLWVAGRMGLHKVTRPPVPVGAGTPGYGDTMAVREG